MLRNDETIISSISVTDIVFDVYLGKWNYRAIPKVKTWSYFLTIPKQLDIEFSREIANNEKYNCLYGAPTLIIVSGSEQAPVPLEADCAAATQNLLLAAESIGLGSCWIFFVLLAFNSPQGSELRKELKIPAGYKPYDSAVLGYKKDAVVNVPERKPNLITYIK